MTVPHLPSPIILIHGLFGFDHLKVGAWTIASYFPGIPEYLEQAGNRVLVARMAPTGGSAERAAQLKAFIDKECPAERVHLIAHSMGGLDARYMISRLGMAERVISLTTVGTPHRGTAFADWGIGRLERLVKPLLTQLRIPHQAFYDLTTSACQKFNTETPDAAGVRYFSVAGKHDGTWFSLEWSLSSGIVAKAEGPNDGVVSIASATWGESIDVWDGDHFSLVNWPNAVARLRGVRPDRLASYGEIVCRLSIV